MYQYKPRFFVGGIYDRTNTEAMELNPVMAADADVLQYGTTTRNRGLGAVFEYDSRDVPVNAYTGLFLDASVINYGGLGGTTEFWVIDLDYRQYLPVGHRHTVAWELRSRSCLGDVPWTEMSQIGTPWDLRGYTWGQFRDELMLFTIGEYRHMYNRKTPNKKGSLESRWALPLCWAWERWPRTLHRSPLYFPMPASAFAWKRRSDATSVWITAWALTEALST